MTAQTPIPVSPVAQPRAIGSVRLTTKARDGQTVIDDLYQQGASKVVFPRADVGLSGVLLNTSGGVTGGDRFGYAATAGTRTHLTLTTQACERAYRAQPGEIGRISTQLSVEDGATLWWLPQETLVFDGCALRRSLRCDLAPGARALIVEPLCIGRIAMGENAVSGLVEDRISVLRDGVPLVQDAWRLAGDMSARMLGSAVGGGATAMVSLTFIAPEAEQHLDRLRALLPDSGGASLLAPDVLVLRMLAPSGYLMRQHLLPILDHVTGGRLPLCWRL
ncbi:urease accessory protein UreD [uncultured Tateyamaria sp.]|uniref:urease accessory protein UreD n=1 Tax=uncultured Tateyamaria sp. TaxID=455651 RepID=UPI002601921C|nr:urease accessory protein UreD [uncultured Tateyamaria sp.]